MPTLQQSRVLLVKLGLLGSQSTVPRQNLMYQCPLVKLGLLGPEQRAHPVPLLQQSQCLLVKLGLLESQSTAPRRNLNSQRLLVKLGNFWPTANGMNSAAAAAAVKSVGAAGPPSYVKYSVTSEPELELTESSGDSSSEKDEQLMQLLCNMEQERALRMLEELRELKGGSFNNLLSLSGSRSSIGDGCKFHPRASDLKPIENKSKNFSGSLQTAFCLFFFALLGWLNVCFDSKEFLEMFPTIFGRVSAPHPSTAYSPVIHQWASQGSIVACSCTVDKPPVVCQ